jgi:hypothetical protein
MAPAEERGVLEREKKDLEETKKKLGLTSWLKLKLLGAEKEKSPVDSQFMADLSDISMVGRYEIIGKLGQGSMGVVFLGRDPYINRHVGIKISRPASDVKGEKADRYREKFFLEAQSAGRLVHPGIVTIYDAGMYKDFCYITMEYVDGPSCRNTAPRTASFLSAKSWSSSSLCAMPLILPTNRAWFTGTSNPRTS